MRQNMVIEKEIQFTLTQCLNLKKLALLVPRLIELI